MIPNAKNIADIRNYSAWKRYDLSRLRTFHNFSNVFVAASDSTILIAGTPKEDHGLQEPEGLSSGLLARGWR